MRNIIMLVTMTLFIATITYLTYQKELILDTGITLRLELAPVDPRSLMQGDYMALRFELADQIKKEHANKDKIQEPNNYNPITSKDGYVIVKLDEKRIATYKTLYEDGITLGDNEIKLQYRIRQGKVKFATNAFFFQEGTAKAYEASQYGEFRINEHGGLLLANMYDKELNKIETNTVKTDK